MESSFSLYGGGEINKINNNELSESYVGISLYSGSDNIVSNNNFDMVIFGIISASCESITVTPEIIDDDFDMLITATINIGTNDNTIKNNVFDESFIGIATLSGASNIITNNSLVSTGQLQLGILSVSLKSVYFEGDSDMYNSDKDIIPVSYTHLRAHET